MAARTAAVTRVACAIDQTLSQSRTESLAIRTFSDHCGRSKSCPTT